ncbi:hypothetical protein K2173_022865 [Erythroxylum novogranatense]|uniref:Uncharacterized protein n=1 Tax=Erythroxylum novogranatense TaxID=1862640 RepID=A0AAV8SNT8_9ROSI|nr:hypothetical protein K2173_022865 [Erythroxylum novogranatense]
MGKKKHQDCKLHGKRVEKKSADSHVENDSPIDNGNSTGELNQPPNHECQTTDLNPTHKRVTQSTQQTLDIIHNQASQTNASSEERAEDTMTIDVVSKDGQSSKGGALQSGHIDPPPTDQSSSKATSLQGSLAPDLANGSGEKIGAPADPVIRKPAKENKGQKLL